MKKLTAGIFATLLAVVSVGAAHAEIASKGYVDQQVGTKADAATVSSLQGTVSGHTSQIGTINDTIGGYGDIVTHDASEFATSAQGQKQILLFSRLQYRTLKEQQTRQQH